MNLTRVRLVLGALCVTLCAASSASAQVFGTFAWQMQPYCNIVSLTLSSSPAGFVLEGTDNQCGAVDKASAVGVASFNANGLVNLNFTIVTAPSARAVHVAAVVNPGTGGGTWTDSAGNTGTFALGAPGSGSPRPLPTTSTCPAGQVVTGVNQNGTVVCAAPTFAPVALECTRVLGTPVSVPANTYGFGVSANCPAGYTATSLGIEAAANVVVADSAISSGGGTVFTWNLGGTAQSTRGWVQCCRVPGR